MLCPSDTRRTFCGDDELACLAVVLLLVGSMVLQNVSTGAMRARGQAAGAPRAQRDSMGEMGQVVMVGGGLAMLAAGSQEGSRGFLKFVMAARIREVLE